MRRAILSAMLPAFALAFAFGAAAQAGDEPPNPYVALMAAKAPHIVTVKFVLKSQGGRGGERSREVQGTVVDPSGLVMISKTHLGGGREVSFQGGRVRQGGGRAVPSNFKVVFPGDEKEYESILGATDSNLNLSFIRIKNLEGKKIEAASFADAATLKIGQELVGVSRHGKGFDYAPLFERGLVAGEIRQPRPMWIVTAGTGALGLPLYDLQGKAAGVMAMQQGADGGGGGGSFLIPAATVKAAVEQAVKQSEEALKKEAEKAKEAKEGEEGEGEKKREKPPEDEGEEH
jgi:hypothetical protein